MLWTPVFGMVSVAGCSWVLHRQTLSCLHRVFYVKTCWRPQRSLRRPGLFQSPVEHFVIQTRAHLRTYHQPVNQGPYEPGWPVV
jgi:hypothetical protein